MNSLFVINLEKSAETNVIGVYATEKLAKEAAIEYVENVNSETIVFKRKQIKKDNTESRKVLFLQDTKEGSQQKQALACDSSPMSITMCEVKFDFSKVKHKKEKVTTPNKSLSPFIIFNKENREKIKTANPDVSFGELGKLIGNAWKALNDTEKSIYVKKAEDDKQRYQTEMDTYTNKL